MGQVLLLAVVLVIIVIPVGVYFAMKLGTYAFFKARQRFENEEKFDVERRTGRKA